MLGRLDSHPDIVSVFDAGTTSEGDPYLVMEHLPGGTLAQRLRAEGRMPAEEAVPIAIRLAGALATAHRNRIVHGDLKPQNVLWSAADMPALADFGIARLRSTTLSTGTAAVFTPLHAAPELFDGHRPTELTDIYGLGSTLFELLDGRPAAGDDADTPLTVVGRIARRERRSLDPDVVPASLIGVVDRAMAYEPADRYQSVEEMGAALQAVERELGLPPTRMVVLDLPDTAPTPIPDSQDGTGDAADGGDHAAGEPDRPTIPPDADAAEAGGADRPGRRRLLVGAVVSLVVAAVVGGGALLLRDPDGVASAPTSTDPIADGNTSTTYLDVDEQPYGLQPRVTYDVRNAPDTTPGLNEALSDIDAIAAPLGTPTGALEGKVFDIGRTPATLRYRTFHPRWLPGCKGFTTNPITLVGRWHKMFQTDADTLVSLAVLDFATEEQADEAYVALSIGQGPPVEDCTGFNEGWGVADWSELDIDHQDASLLGLDKTARFNNFQSQGSTPEFPMYLNSFTGVVQRDATLIAFAVLTTARKGPTDPAPVAAMLDNVLSRLPR